MIKPIKPIFPLQNKQSAIKNSAFKSKRIPAVCSIASEQKGEQIMQDLFEI
jgi:hypothetical protein